MPTRRPLASFSQRTRAFVARASSTVLATSSADWSISTTSSLGLSMTPSLTSIGSRSSCSVGPRASRAAHGRDCAASVAGPAWEPIGRPGCRGDDAERRPGSVTMTRRTVLDRGGRAATAVLLLALLAAACGRSGPARPEAERPSPGGSAAAGDVVYAGNPELGQLQVLAAGGKAVRTMPAGVPSPDWRTLYVAVASGDRTTVEAVDAASGRVLRSLEFPGRFTLPVVGTAGVPDGLSGDGGTLVLANTVRAPVSRFAVLSTSLAKQPKLVDLPGDFEFDALSPDGSRLYVIEHLAGQDRSRYRVRFYDRGAGRLDKQVIVDKRDAWETSMAGYPNTRVTEPGGAWVYTLYRNAHYEPFIHALNAQDGFAFCIDLPRGGAGGRDDRLARQWALVRDPASGGLYAVNTALGVVAEIDGQQQFTVTHTAAFPPDRPAAAAPAGSGSLALSQDRGLLLAGGAHGVLAIRTGSLEVQQRYLGGWAVDGLVTSADGRRVYALSRARGQIAAFDLSSGALVGQRAAPGASLLLRAAAA